MGFTSQAGQLLICKQTTPGTFEAGHGTKAVAIKLRSGSFGTNRDLLVPDPEIGGGRDTADAYLGAVSWSGDFDFYARTDALATLLYGVLGAAAAPNTEDGVTTHVITPSDAAQLPFFSVEEVIGNGLESYKYTDVVINSLHLEADANGYMQGTVSLIGARQEAGITKTASPLWDNTPMYVGTNITVTYNSVALPAKSFSLDINNNFEDDDFRLGSFYLGDLTPKQREITASFNLRHASSALWRQAVYGAAAATVPGGTTVKAGLEIEALTYEDIPNSTPAVKYGISLDIPKFVLSPFSFEASGDDILENDVEGRALRPDPSDSILTATIVTDKATIS
jgi:hypothetical protein